MRDLHFLLYGLCVGLFITLLISLATAQPSASKYRFLFINGEKYIEVQANELCFKVPLRYIEDCPVLTKMAGDATISVLRHDPVTVR